MKTKLIKLSESHYIIVDDSEIKEDDLCYDKEGDPGHNNTKYVVKCLRTAPDSYWNKYSKKITHSTEPLETVKVPDEELYMKGFKYIKKLYLSEVEEVVNGYQLNNLAADYYDQMVAYDTRTKGQFLGLRRTAKERNAQVDGYIDGFKAHQELTKDKLLVTDKNLLDFLYLSRTQSQYTDKAIITEFKQSLLSKTEWEITFDEQGKIKLI